MLATPVVYEGSLQRRARAGDGSLVKIQVPAAVSADSNQVIPVSALLGGLYVRSGMTAGRSDTTPTAAQLDAAFEVLDVGDSVTFVISVTVAFALTLVGGSGVTLAGKTVVPASGSMWFVATKTGATTYTITGL
jgi:hypothetical protein